MALLFRQARGAGNLFYHRFPQFHIALGIYTELTFKVIHVCYNHILIHFDSSPGDSLGIAYVAATCTDFACALDGDRSFTGYAALTHEIGHKYSH